MARHQESAKNIPNSSLAYWISFSCKHTAVILSFSFWVGADRSSQSVNRVEPVSGFQTVKTRQLGQRLLNQTLTWKWSYLYANFRFHASVFPVMLGCCKFWMNASSEPIVSGAVSLSVTLGMWSNPTCFSNQYEIWYWVPHFKIIFVNNNWIYWILLEITWTSELGSTGWRLNQCSFPLYLQRSSFRIDTLPVKTQTDTLKYNSSTQMGKYTCVSALLHVTYQQVGPFGKRSWHKHRRINTETDVGSQSRSPLHRKGCK